MGVITLPLERRARDYEDALDGALEALRDHWDAYSDDIAMVEELRNAFRVADIPRAAA